MKYSKYIILFTLLTVSFLNSFGQIQANLILNSNPPSYLSDWGNGRAGQLIINNTGNATQVELTGIKIRTSIFNENMDLVCKSILNSAQTITLNRGQNIIRMDRVLQLENQQFSALANYLARSGKLSPGLYTLTVEIFDATTGKLLTNIIERIFNQVNYVLPFLLSPVDKSWLDPNTAQSAIQFRWSSLVPLSQEKTTYRLQVFEILNNQTPMQALRSNQPILDTYVDRTTQYIWRPNMNIKNAMYNTFIWTVQTLDYKGEPVSIQDQNSQGRSEPRVFGICQDQGMDKTKCGEGYNWQFN
ncbi:hypothetical protein [Lacihabitans sp. LS3-19]|uniref:hypothetical protein n=1 Tax=Lacihabitans sp. LS3-19 TaxID=2487335 RepID=UPI0020CC1AE3|nr:hypothetical protein [Lacihabitans sp. LS3-19]